MPARLSLTLAACASVLALSACKDDNASAPAAYDFASAPPALIDVDAPAGYADYAPAERAYAFDRATYRTAPSYGFRYGEDEPWAWRTADDYSMYAEPYDEGYRNYYYAPGADYPYFVRDDDYGYGYGPDGALVAVYDSRGDLLPQDRLYALATIAGAYLVRASAIRRYGLDDQYRVAVTEDYWSARAPRYYEVQQVWYTAPDRQPQWRAWRASHQTEVAQYLPRGEVRRWSKDDEKAWKAYEKADRKAWQAEDKAWRKNDRRNDRQVAVAAPPAPAVRDDRPERGDARRAERPPEQLRQARIEGAREQGRHGRPERVEVATADPRPNKEFRREASQAPQAKPPKVERPHGGGRRDAQVATAQPPRPEAAPQRQHGGNKHADARQEPAVAQAAPPQPQRAQGHGGRPERGPDRAAPAPQDAAPQGGHAKGGGKPDGKGRDKGKE
jgi:hypothetical protein